MTLPEDLREMRALEGRSLPQAVIEEVFVRLLDDTVNILLLTLRLTKGHDVRTLLTYIIVINFSNAQILRLLPLLLLLLLVFLFLLFLLLFLFLSLLLLLWHLRNHLRRHAVRRTWEWLVADAVLWHVSHTLLRHVPHTLLRLVPHALDGMVAHVRALWRLLVEGGHVGLFSLKVNATLSRLQRVLTPGRIRLIPWTAHKHGQCILRRIIFIKRLVAQWVGDVRSIRH